MFISSTVGEAYLHKSMSWSVSFTRTSNCNRPSLVCHDYHQYFRKLANSMNYSAYRVDQSVNGSSEFNFSYVC